MNKNKVNSPYPDELTRAHVTLREKLAPLEAAAGKMDERTPLHLATCLEKTLSDVAEHFRLEEQNGYMNEVLREEPRLERRVQALHNQHLELKQTLFALVEETKKANKLDGAFGKRIQEWLRALARHEAAENAIVEEAFNTDLSAED